MPDLSGGTAFVDVMPSMRGYFQRVRRAGEFQGAPDISLQSLYQAWRRARRQKVPSHNQLRFDSDWMCNLIQLQRELQAGTWEPRPSTCFIATRPKAREIHAPDFADRVVHHWLIPQLEAIYEPGFIHDSPEFVIQEPDTGTMLELQSDRTSLRQGLRLLLLDQYETAEPFIEALSWDEFIDWQRDVFEYFGLDARRFEERQAANRFERRRRRR